MFLLLTGACTLSNGLNSKEDPRFEDDDSGITESTGPDEECNGVDDDGDGEVDEGYPDADGNGRADCLDGACPPLDLGVAGVVELDEACVPEELPPVDDPWDVVIEWNYASTGEGVVVMPAVGDLTGDGLPDIAFTTYEEGNLVLISGEGDEIFSLPGYDGMGGTVIADVDGDGTPEIVTTTEDYRLTAVSGDGRTLWTSAAPSAASGGAQPTVGDLDGDGIVEVLADRTIVEGTDGSPYATLVVYPAWTSPVFADLDLDGRQEIITGGSVFDAEGTLLWSNEATKLSAFSAVADVDGDPEGEVISVTQFMGYIHDSDGTLLTTFAIPGDGYPGPPAVADFDGDGAVEIAVTGSFLCVFETDGTLVWQSPMFDNAGVSAFDLDGDGAYEILAADATTFRIYDGSGTVRFEDPDYDSGTLYEYPVIVDVDADGAAEIVVAENQGSRAGITVYGQADGTWRNPGPSWGIHDYAADRLEDDGTVLPAAPWWQTDNLFRARTVQPTGHPNLAVEITDVCVADCDYGPVQVAVQVSNRGPVDAASGTTLAIYAIDESPRLVATVTLPRVPAGAAIEGITVDLAPADVGRYGFGVTVDDDGTGAGSVEECDETDNATTWTASWCP